MLIDKLMFYCFTWAIFWIPFVAVPAGTFGKTFTDLGLECALLLWLIKLVVYRTTGFKKIGMHIDRALLFLGLASAASIPFSYMKLWSIGDFAGILVGIFAVYLMISTVKTKKEFFIMMVSLLAGITIAAFLGLWQIPLKFMLYYHPERAAFWFIKPLVFLTTSNINTRVASTFIEYSGVNVYAGYLTIMITLLLTPLVLYFKRISLPWKLVSALSLGLLLVNLVLTKGRAAYITLLATLIFIACQNDRLRKPLLMAILIASFCAFTAVPMVRNSVLEIFSTSSVSNQERVMIYKPALQQALARPIFGFGDGHAGRKIERDKNTGQWIESKDKRYFAIYTSQARTDQEDYYARKGIIAIQRPHNIFLTTIIDTGITGCAALIYVFICLIQGTLMLYRRKKDELQAIFSLGLAGGFIAIIVYGFFHDSLNARPYAMLFWILIGLAGASLKIAADTKTQQGSKSTSKIKCRTAIGRNTRSKKPGR